MEAYIGTRGTPIVTRRGNYPRFKNGKSGSAQKRPIVALVERGGEVRAQYAHHVTAATVRDVLVRKANRASRLHTDESQLYPVLGAEFASHETVNHATREYARGDVTTNSVEGFFGVFKRGFRGIYQHCGEQHLQRYLNEYAFRYNNRIKLGVDDDMRALIALRGIEGKRLTYRRINAA